MPVAPDSRPRIVPRPLRQDLRKVRREGHARRRNADQLHCGVGWPGGRSTGRACVAAAARGVGLHSLAAALAPCASVSGSGLVAGGASEGDLVAGTRWGGVGARVLPKRSVAAARGCYRLRVATGPGVSRPDAAHSCGRRSTSVTAGALLAAVAWPTRRSRNRFYVTGRVRG